MNQNSPSDAEDGDVIRKEVQAPPVFDSDSESGEPVNYGNNDEVNNAGEAALRKEGCQKRQHTQGRIQASKSAGAS